MKSFKFLLISLAITFAIIMSFSTINQKQAMFAEATRKGTDILFLKGKFILKDKKGSIVISDDKKPCMCGHYYRR